ncbi:MAG: hypothetical protein JSV13_00665 [Nitrospiraceae bacterium]|nr:MAG: hypothetical protein JSV13_00665 [Nitrospiraceae bacterium]
MKKVLVGLTVVALLAFGSFAFAHGTGWWGGGHMGYGSGGYGYGGHMMSPGYGGHMYGERGGYDQKFLDETADLRKELHSKKFEYFEAVRNPETGNSTITKLEKEIREIQEKIYEKSPRTAYRGSGTTEHCW